MPKHRTAIALFLLGLVACPPTAKVSVFNGTDHTVVLAYFDTTKSIPPGESRDLRVQTQESHIEIYSADGLRAYNLSLRDVPHDTFRDRWGGGIRVQLEPDGRIFILKRGQEFPQAFIEGHQPPGFPLTPVLGKGAAQQARLANLTW